mmetsp:Transcript_128030/g.370524  ORF Transcript_128030/g.370524 Transcript_128030/m.370524 type:complete len:200 (+) Transcript_128030:743-1342(+)
MWRWEGDLDAVGEKAWPVALWHARVHHRTVPVALHIRAKALVLVAPSHLADLARPQPPVRKAVESQTESWHQGGIHQIDKCIAKVATASEVNGQVDEVVLSSESLAVQQFQKHGSRVAVGQVAQHQGSAVVYTLTRLSPTAGGTFVGPAHRPFPSLWRVLAILLRRASAAVGMRLRATPLAGSHSVGNRILLAVAHPRS